MQCLDKTTQTPNPRLLLKRKVDLLGILTESLSPLLELVDRLVASDTTTPVSPVVLVLLEEVGLGGRDEGSKSLLVLGPDFGDSDGGGSLLAGHQTEPGLALDDNVRDTHLPAESGEEDDELNRVNIVGNDDELSLLGLDEGNNVVETVLGEDGLLSVGGGGLVTLLLSLLGLRKETSLLLLGRLRLVLVEELEELSGGVLVEGVGELGDGRGDLEGESAKSRIKRPKKMTNLQSLVEDDLLPLETNVLGPLDESSEVPLGRKVATYNRHWQQLQILTINFTNRYQRSWTSSRREGSGPSYQPSWCRLEKESGQATETDRNTLTGSSSGLLSFGGL